MVDGKDDGTKPADQRSSSRRLLSSLFCNEIEAGALLGSVLSSDSRAVSRSTTNTFLPASIAADRASPLTKRVCRRLSMECVRYGKSRCGAKRGRRRRLTRGKRRRGSGGSMAERDDGFKTGWPQ